MANPCGTRTPCPDSFWNISPSEAFLPPTSGTSSMPNSSKKRTYLDVLITCPLVAHQAPVALPEPPHQVPPHRSSTPVCGVYCRTQRHKCQLPTAARTQPGPKVTRMGDSRPACVGCFN